MNEIEKVKRKLWTFGLSVKDVSSANSLGFDLLVDEHYKVIVLRSDDDRKLKRNEVIAIIKSNGAIEYRTAKGLELSPLKAFKKVEK